MYRHFIFFSLLLVSLSLRAQDAIPSVDHSSVQPKKIIKEDETGRYFVSYDPSKIAYLAKVNEYSKSYYKLFDQSYNLLAEGELYGSERYGLWRNGKWTEYYPNGTLKITGSYYHGHEIGIWNNYYTNGQLKESKTITLVEVGEESRYCLSGAYQEFYENGQLKVNGFYRVANDRDTIYHYDDDDMNRLREKRKVVMAPVSKPIGQWIYYKQNGEIEKQEEFIAPSRKEKELRQYPDLMPPKYRKDNDDPRNEKRRTEN